MLVLLSGTVLFVYALIGYLHIEHEGKKAQFTGAVNCVISYSHTKVDMHTESEAI